MKTLSIKYIMHLDKFLYTKFGRILMSILLGFGLASMMRKVCKQGNCYRFDAPDFKSSIKDKTFQYNGECYQFDLQAGSHDSTKTTISI